ncbi:hypothetical protein J7K44_02270 [bacterium]|nr:hypothetical protein [bacterium]
MKRKKVKKIKKKKSQKRKIKERKIKTKAKRKSVKIIKIKENPIISPNSENGWESWQTFNPGVILLEEKIHFLYRAIGNDGISRLGYASSFDGFFIDERLPYPVYEHKINPLSFCYFSFTSGGGLGGAEDPRPVRVDKEKIIYMTYTACQEGLRIALTSIKVKDFLNKKWHWKKPVLISPPNEVHKNWVIFPEKINGYYAILHSLNPKISIDFFDNLNFDGKTFIKSYYDPNPTGDYWNWEAKIRGVGPPPIKTKYGWLIFYHAEEKGDLGKYKVGAMLLNLNFPQKVLTCFKKPILEPEKEYENNGFKGGVVYASGAIVKNNDLLIYYGGADSYVCVAYCDFNEFLKFLIKEKKPKLKKKILKRKK